MSASTCSNTGNSASARGHRQSRLRHQRSAVPTVFSVTVLPPVFGPLISSVRQLGVEFAG